jgi:hypothetical protein
VINVKQGERKRIFLTLDDIDTWGPDDFTGVEFFLGVKAERSNSTYQFSKVNEDFDISQVTTGIISFLMTEDDSREHGIFLGELTALFGDSDETLWKSGDLFFNIQKAVIT